MDQPEGSTIEQNQVESPAEVLAHSAFGFAFFALIPAFIVLIVLLLTPAPPDPAYARIHQAIVIGCGLMFIVLAAFCWILFRVEPARLVKPAGRLAALLANRWIVLAILFLLFEVNALAFITLPDIAPTITGPGKFLLLCWSLLLVGIIVTANLRSLTGWIVRTRQFWSFAGLTVAVLIGGFLLYFVNLTIVDHFSLTDRLRGSFDTRALSFFDEGMNAERSRAFWSEAGEVQARWQPYVYWTMSPLSGEYINIDASGLRKTANFVEKDDPQAQQIFVFGGSTGWGEGARDDYTIPSQVSRLLHEQGQSTYVTNYAQTGYVSTQDLVLFQLQLTLENAPDVAVFYQGFNDIIAAYQADVAGLPHNETNRFEEFVAGRWLAEGRPVFKRPTVSLKDYDLSPVATASDMPEEIVDRYLGNVRLINAAAAEYGVKVLIVWQPALIYKQTLTPSEQIIRRQIDDETPGFAESYDAVDRLFRQQIADGDYGNILIISDLFAAEEDSVFFDRVHIFEAGDLAVAQAIVPVLTEILNSQSDG